MCVAAHAAMVMKCESEVISAAECFIILTMCKRYLPLLIVDACSQILISLIQSFYQNASWPTADVSPSVFMVISHWKAFRAFIFDPPLNIL